MIHKILNTSQGAWEYLNESLFQKEEWLKKQGAGRDGGALISYDNLIFINKAWVDPNFNFGKVLGYGKHKWTHLVKNYVDINYLDILKAEVTQLEKIKKRTYTISYHFNNNHANGKDCLISIIFSRRLNSDIPILIFHTRATECTKRLLFDFLLVQRIGEYIYGAKQTFSIQFYSPMAYINIESFTLYLNEYWGKIDINLNPQPFRKKTEEVFHHFTTCKPKSLKYVSHGKIASHIQGAKYTDMFAKDLQLIPTKIEYPEDCLTDDQRRKYRAKLKTSL